MYLRLVQFKAKVEEVSNLQTLYSGTIIPTLQGTPGCLYACLMQSSADPQDVVSMTLWETQVDAEAYMQGGLFDHLMKQVRPLLAETTEWRVGLSRESKLEYEAVPQEPAISMYPVTLDLPTKQMDGTQARSMYLRLVSVKLKAEKRDEFHRLYITRVIPALQETKGCRHAYLVMPSKGGHEVISVTIWDSKEDADQYERTGVFAGLVNSVKHTFTDLFQWKMELDRNHQQSSSTTEDLKVDGYSVVSGKSFE